VPEDRLSTRLLDQARQYREPPADAMEEIVALWASISDDAITMQNGWQLTSPDVHSSRPVVGWAITRARRAVQRALYPLPRQQTEFNLAVNRIVTHLLRHADRQARVIGRLVDEVEELNEELRRRG
jgi:hypothetical protein